MLSSALTSRHGAAVLAATLCRVANEQRGLDRSVQDDRAQRELEDIALVYFEKMLAGRTAVSNALDHTMNSMLILYMAPMSSAKSIERMSKEKSPIKTMPEHYQILVYVEERYINWSSMGYKIAAGRRYRSSRTQC